MHHLPVNHLRHHLRLHRNAPPSSGLHAFESIKLLCKQGLIDDAIRAVTSVDERYPFLYLKVFDCLLDSCGSAGNLVAGLRLQCLIVQYGFGFNEFLGRRLIRMFVSCGSLTKANDVFFQLVDPSVFTWSSIILAHIKLGQSEGIFPLFFRMQLSNIESDAHTYVAVIKACSEIPDLQHGKVIHLHIVEGNLRGNVVVGNALISMYISCGIIEAASRVFTELQERDVVSWNTMIGGFSIYKCDQEALSLLWQMQVEGFEADRVTYINILKACTNLEASILGKWIHGLLLEHGIVVNESIGSSLILMYANTGDMEGACKIFSRMETKTLVAWNTLIVALLQHGYAIQALEIFKVMIAKAVDPDEILLATVLKSCTELEALDHGRYIHACIVKKGYVIDTLIGNSLLSLYCRSGNLHDACAIFVRLPESNVITWSTIIAGFAQNGHFNEASRMFIQMQYEGVHPNQITYVNILKSSTADVDCQWSTLIHDQIIKIGLDKDVFIASALIKAYIDSRSLLDARRVFDRLMMQNLVTWNVMLAGYAQHQAIDAIHLFSEMQEKGIDPNSITLSGILKACSLTSALYQGMLIHNYIFETGIKIDRHIGTSLIMMYTMCGSLRDGCNFFEYGSKDNVSLWNAIITGCAQHRDCNLALHYFEYMLVENIKPNKTTFASLLASCDSDKSVVEAIRLFRLMVIEFHIVPASNHYDCFINLLGRAGNLCDAVNMVITIPSVPSDVDCAGLTSLLSNCRTHGSMELGIRAFQFLSS